MSKISTPTLLFTVLLLHLATTAISNHVRRASSSEQHPSPRFHVVRHDSLAEQHSSPRFHVVGHDSLAEQHSSPCSHLASGSWARGFQPGDHKPTPEQKLASRFMNPGRPRKALIEIASRFNKAAESAGQASDHKPTPEEKAPPQFRIKPVKPPNVDHKPKAPPRFRIKPVKPRYVPHLAKKPTPAQPKRKTPGPPAYFHKLTAPAGPRRHLIRRAQNPHLIRRAQNPHLIRRAQTPITPSPSPTVTEAPTPSPFPSPSPAVTTAGGKRWCVAKEDASDQVLQAYIDYTCKKGVDCKPIQKGGDCFDSTSLKSRASFVMNAFYNIHGRKNCHFGRSGVLTTTNPSYGNCTYI